MVSTPNCTRDGRGVHPDQGWTVLSLPVDFLLAPHRLWGTGVIPSSPDPKSIESEDMSSTGAG